MSYSRLKDQHKINLIPLSYYHKSIEHNYLMLAHNHPYLEIMYCREGEFNVEIYTKNDHTGVTKKEIIPLKEKQFIMLDAGITHSVSVEKGKSAFISNIEWKMVPMHETPPPVNSLIKIDAYAIFENLDGLQKFMNSPLRYVVSLDSENVEHYLVTYINLAIEKGNDLTSQCNLQSRLILLLTEIDKCLTSSEISTGINYIRRAQVFIKNNFNRHISIDDIAQSAGVTKGYLQKLFHAHTGMSILRYLNSFRISKCKRMLLETSFSIETICSHVGFHNRQQLIYEFKVQTGMTPSVYRTTCARKNFNYNPISGEYISSDIDGNLIF